MAQLRSEQGSKRSKLRLDAVEQRRSIARAPHRRPQALRLCAVQPQPSKQTGEKDSGMLFWVYSAAMSSGSVL